MQKSTVEYVRSSPYHALSLGFLRGLFTLLLVFPGYGNMGRRYSNAWILDPYELDVHIKIHKTARALYPLSGRFLIVAHLHSLRLSSRFNQDLRHVIFERGTLRSKLLIISFQPLVDLAVS